MFESKGNSPPITPACSLPIVNTAQTLEVFILSQFITDAFITVFARSVWYKILL